MNVKNLKIVIAAILTVANIFFIVMISLNFHHRNYYDRNTVEKAYNIIERDGMKISRGILERKQKKFYVYTGGMYISLFDDIISVYGELEKSSSGDVSVVSGEGRFVFHSDCTFDYTKDGEDGNRLYEDMTLPDVSETGRIKKNAKKIIDNFLRTEDLSKCFSNSKSSVKTDIEIEKILFDSSSVTYIVYGYQTFEKEKVSEEGVIFVIRNGEVISAKGEFSFIYPTEKIPADCIDMLNVVFSEKAYFKDSGNVGGIISDISYFYKVYDSAEGKRYFIPMCRVEYENTTNHSIYNLVSGNRE